MRRGPKPKPTALHRLHGSLNPTRHRDRAFEPIAPGSLAEMEPPADLSDEELATWRYALQHAPKGVLKHIDRTVLILWVKTAERYRRAEAAQAQINAQAPMPDVIRSPTGMLVQSPYIGMMNRAALLMLRIAEQLGFTPVARPRLVGESQQDGDDDGRRWMQVLSPSNRP